MSGVINLLTGSESSVFTAVLNRNDLYGYRNGKGVAQTSSSVTCSPVNGSGPFTYVWTYVAGDTDIFAFTSGIHTTLFGAFMETPGDFYSATWLCTITDSLTNTAVSEEVSIILERGT